MPMLATDSRSKWDGSIFDDPRVTNLWDEDRVLGRWLAQRDDLNATRFGPIVWDAFLVFGASSDWQESPSALLATGSPVIGETSKLGATVASALEQDSSGDG